MEYIEMTNQLFKALQPLTEAKFDFLLAIGAFNI